eukprot:gene16381-4999_t
MYFREPKTDSKLTIICNSENVAGWSLETGNVGAKAVPDFTEFLTHCTPYTIRWSRIALCFVEGPLPQDSRGALMASVGALVGLASVPTESISHYGVVPGTNDGMAEAQPAIQMLTQPGPYPCHGLGIVRNVDLEKGEYQILSPLNVTELFSLNINCFVIGKQK